jgi:heterodisulfide reductase subunit A
VNEKETILIVDDEGIVRDSLGQWFREEGYEVGVAESSSDALTRMAENRWNLALVDIKL